MAKKKVKTASYVIIAILAIIAIGILIIALNSSSKSSTTGQVISGQNCREEQIPYEETEEYTETVPYTDRECNAISMIWKSEYVDISQSCIQEECESYNQVCIRWNYNFWGNPTDCAEYGQGSCASYKCIKYRQDCGLKIENKEKEGTTFSLELYKWNTENTQTPILITTRDLWVSPLDSAATTWSFTYLPTESVGCWFKIVNNPTIQECRDVTKYRDVIKTRVVTKYRTETICD